MSTTQPPIDTQTEQFDNSTTLGITTERAEEILAEMWGLTLNVAYLRIELNNRVNPNEELHLAHHEQKLAEKSGETPSATAVAQSFINTVREKHASRIAPNSDHS